MNTKKTYNYSHFEEIFNVSRNTLIKKLISANVYERLKGAKVFFEDEARLIFDACGSDYDVFIQKKLTNQ